MDLHAEIAAANGRKDKERVRALGKRFGGLRTKTEKLALLCQALRRFESEAAFSVEMMAQWKSVQAALKLVEKDRLIGIEGGLMSTQ
jgi:hypothetical protein